MTPTPFNSHYPPARWPLEITGLPVRLHPDGQTALVSFADVPALLGISASGVRERRRQKRLPPIVYRDGNTTYCDLAALADAYLDEHPQKALPLPDAAPRERPQADTQPPETGETAPVRASEARQEVRHELRQSEAVADGMEAVRSLLRQVVSLERESDSQVTALTQTVAAQSRIIEGLGGEMAALRVENEGLRAAPEKASEVRQVSVWDRLTGRRK